MKLGTVLVAVCSFAAPGVPVIARAQVTNTDTAIAEALYQQGRNLMAEGKYEQACSKFAESLRVDHATGTLLNLASCHEQLGRLASAWTEYHEAIATARRDGREDRVQFARARIADIEPRLSRLTLQLAPDARVPELKVSIDGVQMGEAAIGLPAPVDPGPHLVEAIAPGKQSWSQEITLGPNGDMQTLTIPPLQDAPDIVEPAEPLADPSPPAVTPEHAAPPADALAQSRPIPRSVFAAGAATLAVVGGAAVTGLLYVRKRSDFETLNVPGNADDAGKQDASDEARRMGFINVGLWSAAGVGAAVTTVLYLTRPTVRQRAARVTPWIDPEGAGGLIVRGEL